MKARRVKGLDPVALLGDNAELEIDLSGLLRGSPQERWQNYDIASKHQILTANEIREAEGWNPRTQQVDTAEA